MRFRDVGRFRVERRASASSDGFLVERRSGASLWTSTVALSVWSCGVVVSERRFATLGGFHVYRRHRTAGRDGRNRIAVVTYKNVYGDNDEYFSLNGRTIFDFGKMQGIVTTTTLDVSPGNTGSGSVNSAGHAVLSGTLVLNLTSGNLMRATADAFTYSSYSPTVSVEGIANIYNANVSGGGGTTYTASSPLSIDANDDISIDLSGYAALSGATFTGAVTGFEDRLHVHADRRGEFCRIPDRRVKEKRA